MVYLARLGEIVAPRVYVCVYVCVCVYQSHFHIKTVFTDHMYSSMTMNKETWGDRFSCVKMIMYNQSMHPSSSTSTATLTCRHERRADQVTTLSRVFPSCILFLLHRFSFFFHLLLSFLSSLIFSILSFYPFFLSRLPFLYTCIIYSFWLLIPPPLLLFFNFLLHVPFIYNFSFSFSLHFSSSILFYFFFTFYHFFIFIFTDM